MSACIDSGDTAWMLLSTMFVFLQIPATGILQAGMIRKKNSLSILMQVMSGLSIGSIMYYLFGYSLSFGPSKGGVIGNADHFGFANVHFNECNDGTTIPSMLFATFQMMFAVLTPVVITGAFAEKLTFRASTLFFIIWPILCYYPISHWVWGGGWLGGYIANESFTFKVLDFAGDHVIHTNAGVAGLVISHVIAPRNLSKEKDFIQYHNIPLVVIGGSLIYIGWFGFNAGSTLVSDGQASITLLNTHMSACISSLVWLFLSYNTDGKFHIIDFISGIMAGLAGITGGSGYVPLWASLVIGLISGFTSYYFCQWINHKTHLDDVLDVASLQMVPGITGAILVGLFAKESVGGENGAFYGHGKQLAYQIIGLVAVLAWSSFFTYVTLMIIDKLVGLDLSEEAKIKGLDAIEYGEICYVNVDEDSVALDIIMDAVKTGNMVLIKRLKSSGADFAQCDYDNRYPLLVAVENNQHNVVRFLLQETNADVNCQDNFGNTPLNTAIKNSFVEMAELIRSSGANNATDHKLGESLCTFAANGDLESIKQYHACQVSMNMSDYDFRTPLHIACSYGHFDIVKYLLEQNDVDVNATDRWGFTPLNDAEKTENTELSDYVKSKGGKLSQPINVGQICEYASSGNIKEIKKYAENGNNVIDLSDYDRRTLLILATSNNQMHLVKYLVQNNAEINTIDKFGRTALNEAIKCRNHNIFNFLLDNGAKVNAQDIGSKLCLLVTKNDLDTITMYCRAHVNPNSVDYDNRTMLHIAVSESNFKIVQYLLTVNADPTIKDRFGNSAYTIADSVEKTPDSHKVLDLLEQYRTKLDNRKRRKSKMSDYGSINVV